jgi:glycine/D-amino acid oxidase-like deaminating enzyme
MEGAVDVVIVGGGVIGSAIAYFLAADPAFDGRVVVIERDPTYQRASSALSASSIRQQFSTPENIRMSQFGFAFLRDADRHLGIDDPAGRPVLVGLVERGYLYLAGPSTERALRESHALQRAEGADVELLAPVALATRFPWLSVDGVALGSLGQAGEGWFDGYGLLQALRRKAQSLGVTYTTGEVVSLVVADRRVTGVRLADGGTVACGSLVDAAGPWARDVAALAGVELPVEARRRVVYVFDARPIPGCPLVVDPSGLWFRPEGEQFLCGTAPPPSEDPAGLPLAIGPADHRAFDERLWPVLAARVPGFDELRLTRAWAGYYEYDTFDQNAILGRHPEVTNLLFANGFSGHGIQQAPAVGRAIAELIVHGRYLSLDLSVFGYERIAAGRRVVERNVIG